MFCLFRKKNILKLIIISAAFCLFPGGAVYASINPGNESGGVSTGCNFPQAYTRVCGADGGVSWHIYSTKNYSGPRYPSNHLELLNGDTSIDVNDIKNACPASQYDWYIAYGWDGRENGPGSNYVHWGPLQWNTGIIAGSLSDYNSNGAIYYWDTIDRIQKGTLGDGQKITHGAAEEFYKAQTGSSTIPNYVGYFCSPFRAKVTLTVKHIDTSGNSLERLAGDIVIDATPGSTVRSKVANLTSHGYRKVKWKEGDNTWNGEGLDVVWENIRGNTTLYAIYEPIDFEGVSRSSEENKNWGNIAENKKAGTGWVKSAKKVIHFINNCDPVNGCTAKFWHDLKRVTGKNETTTYKITRTSNYSSVSSSDNVKSGSMSFSKNGDSKNVLTEVFENKLRPGQIVCETMTFKTNIDAGNISTTACVAALGNAQPEPTYSDPNEGPTGDETSDALINMEVKNQNIDKYNTYRKTVYAKPSDVLSFRATYNPVLQYTYNLKPQKLRINGGTIIPSEGINLNSTLGTMFNKGKGNGLSNWNNAFSVYSSPGGTGFSNNYKYNSGDTTKRTPDNNYSVQSKDVGTTLKETAETNLNNTTKTTPKQVTFSRYNNDQNKEYIIESAKSKDLAIDISGGAENAGNGTNIQVYRKNGTEAQRWILRKNSDGTYRIYNSKSGKSLDLANANTDNYNNIQLYTSNNSCAQKWRLKNNNDGTFTFLSACNTKKALDLYWGLTALRTNIQIHDANNSIAQKWRLISYENVVGNVDTGSINSFAEVKVPYNFKNSTAINTTEDNGETLYAGESKSINFSINVGKKVNTIIGSEYATIVRNAKWKLKIKVGKNNWIETKEYTGNLNEKSILEGSSADKNITINVPDVPAGTRICLKSAVYPATSGADDNLNPKGDGTWTESEESCFDVAKKPSLQVWGGNIYSRGKISTALSAKKVLEGYANYKIEPEKNDKTYVFGSWGEVGLITNGAVTNFSSGAATGYYAADSNGLSPNPLNGINNNNNKPVSPGGSNQTSLCNRSPLTFANFPCSSTTVGSLGATSFVSNIESDKSSFTDKFVYTDNNSSGEISLNDESKKRTDNNIYYYGSNNSLAVNGGTVNKGTIQIVHAKEDIAIKGNLNYDSASNNNFDDLPKLVIYAEKNINIDCAVTRIDALLIAEDSVKTCGDSDDIQSRKNSTQLKINGAIIANTIIPNRTYGAATGANSIIPAEIINYDPSLYLWGGEKTEATSTDNSLNSNLDVTYKKELAPRR